MKREFLQQLQTDTGPLSKETVDAIMAENGRDIQKVRASFADYDALRQKVENLEQTKQQSLEENSRIWQEKLDQAEETHKKQLHTMKLEHCVETAVSAARGRNVRAITALLDMEALSQAENPGQAAAQALEELRKENGYLFEDAVPPPFAKGTGARQAHSFGPATLAGALREKFERK